MIDTNVYGTHTGGLSCWGICNLVEVPIPGVETNQMAGYITGGRIRFDVPLELPSIFNCTNFHIRFTGVVA